MVCNKEYRLSFTKEAEDLVARMTFEEKVRLMAGNTRVLDVLREKHYNAKPYPAGGCDRLGVPRLMFCDGPRGVVSGESTCFPVAMARGATFDRALEKRVGEAIGAEIRAHGANFFGGVCVNIPHHPGGGRSQEVYGEDSYHMSEMACALIDGVQSRHVIACVKHYAFNSMEKVRFRVNVTADKRTEREVFLRHFKKCVDAGAASVMSAYNKYQGEHCGHSRYLLREVLKGEWDFDGFVISDFFLGLRDTVKGLNGGLDVEMHLRRLYTVRRIKRAIAAGKANIAAVDEAAVRIVRTLLAFEQAGKEDTYAPSMIACASHIALARETAEKSITLLKNDGLLPLKGHSVVLIGDLANTPNIGDHGSSMVSPPYVKTLCAAFKEEYPDVRITFVPSKKVNAYRESIRNADAVVVVCGCRHSDEGEYIPQRLRDKGGDRRSLSLHKPDIAMIREAAACNPRCAVVLMGGNVILTDEWINSAAAVLMAYYPGMEGGTALADILMGKVNPSGKLPFAIAHDQKDYPAVDWDTRQIEYTAGYGYRKMNAEGKPSAFAFGFGLSYTTFALSDIRLLSVDTEKAVFGVMVKNTGDVAGAEVVQVYVGAPASGVTRPPRVLAGFEKVEVSPGESVFVSIPVHFDDLTWYNESTASFEAEDTEYIAFIGTDEDSCVNNPVPFYPAGQ